MEKHELLREYLKILRDRESDFNKNNGLTFFALCTALVALIWKLNSNTQQYPVDSFKIIYFYNITITSIYIFSGLFPTRKSQANRYTFHESRTSISPLLFLFLYGLAITASSIYIAKNISGKPEWETYFWTYQATIISFSIFSNAVLILASIYYTSIQKTPNPIEPNENNIDIRIFIFVRISLFLILATNIYLLASNLLPFTSSKEEFSAGFNLAIFQVIIFLLISSLSRSSRSSHLAELEMDFYMSNQSPDEIESRLKSEIIGIYVGDWLTEKMNLLKKKSEDYIYLIDLSRQDFKEIQKIDKNYHHEIAGRINAVMENLESKKKELREYQDEAISWLTHYLKYEKINNSRQLKKLIGDAIQEHKESLEAMNNSLKNLQEDIKTYKDEISQAIAAAKRA